MEYAASLPECDDGLIFVTFSATIEEMRSTELLIDSIRSFGGSEAGTPIWLFIDSSQESLLEIAGCLDAEVKMIEIPRHLRHYELADKVFVCAEAERLAPKDLQSLVWLNSDTLILNPPTGFRLDDLHDAALRPVHIKNIGLAIDEQLNGYWRGIMKCAGIADTDCSVESFVDCQKIRAYFNSHSYCVDPSAGIFRKWLDCFERLVNDADYQNEFCADELHRIFLHQAVLSAVTVARIPPSRIRILPPTYSYPYNLQTSVPGERRAGSLNQLTTVVYEDLSLDPETMAEMEVEEPLRSWLAGRWKKRASETARGR